VLTRELAATLPPILERKRKLSGQVKEFNCRVLHRQGPHLIVLFIARGAMNVHGVELAAGTATFGHFWSDRPYNVYHWLRPDDGRTMGYYVNLSAETEISDDCLQWQDLIVDVLVSADGHPTVLDEDEVPSDLPLRARIAEIGARVLGELPQVLAELEEWRRRLWADLAAQAGGPPGGAAPGVPK
jgi:Protein of unknown function (DUF402)